MSDYLLLQADSRRLPIADGSVHCVVTSPPYWGLRDYGVGGQLGLERTPDEFVAAMVAVFREVRRVLHPTGTVFMNLGDSYATGSAGSNAPRDRDLPDAPAGWAARNQPTIQRTAINGLKPKDLIGIPWRVALALQADGWYLRSDIIWAKPNPMPESVTDRPTKSHEYVFLLAKSERYYFDGEAVREEGVRYAWTAPQFKNGDITRHHGNEKGGGGSPLDPSAGRNIRTVWSISTEAYPGSHFATYPRKLVEPCIRAGTSERGCCPECGAPWEREVESYIEFTQATHARQKTINGDEARDRVAGFAQRAPVPGNKISKTLGWHPTCDHGYDPIPCTVLDPFIGSGTTIVVANALGRRGIGTDLSREYLGLARHRITRPHARVPRPNRAEHHPLFERNES